MYVYEEDLIALCVCVSECGYVICDDAMARWYEGGVMVSLMPPVPGCEYG